MIGPDIRRIKIYYHPDSPRLCGLRLFGRKAFTIYVSNTIKVFKNPSYKYIETVLEEGERIVGIKSINDRGYHKAFQFVIGRKFELTFVKVLSNKTEQRRKLPDGLLRDIYKYM